MGALSNGGTDLALQVATGTLGALDDVGAGVLLRGNFNVSVWGTFVATVALERSFDGGTTWIRVTFSDGGILAYTAPASAVWSEAEYGVMFRLRCTAYTSGTVHWRLSLGSDAATSTPVNTSDGAPNILPNAPLNILASTYNAATNTPAIANNGTGAGAGANNAYVVAVAGTVTVDSIGAVSIGDIIFNSGGTKWLRAPYSAVYKTMSLQDADAVAITGGSATLASVGLTGVGVWTPSLYPDLMWGISDSVGNIGFYIDQGGTAYAEALDVNGGRVGGTLTVDALALTGPLNGETLSATLVSGTTVTAGEAVVREQAMPLPDVAWALTDSAGNSPMFLSTDGTLFVSGLDASELTIEGAPISGTGAPADCVDVTDPAYAAVGDGFENYGTVILTGSTLTISNWSGTATLTQTTASTATLALEQDAYSGVGFAPTDLGAQVFVQFGTYTLQAPVLQWVNGSTVILKAASITAQTSIAASAVWPSFTWDAVGKTIVLDGMGRSRTWINNYATAVAMPQAFGNRAYATTIASYVAPDTVTLAAAPPLPANGPNHIVWGTNNATAVANAGAAAFNSGKRKIFFPGDNSLYLIMALGPGEPTWPNIYGSAPGMNAGPTCNGVLWEGANVRTYVWDGGGVRMHKHAVPLGSDTRRTPPRSIMRGHFARCRNLSTINVLIIGDSQGTAAAGPASETMAAWAQGQRFVEEFQRANPSKTINVYWMANGGDTFAGWGNPTRLYGDNQVKLNAYNLPRPVVGTWTVPQWFANLNRTASGPAIVPDLLVVFQNGGNDNSKLDVPAIHTVINWAQQVSHGDAYGPMDIILQTDHLPVILINTGGNGGGVLFPNSSDSIEYATGMIRSVAASRGLGLVDMDPLVRAAAYGWSPMRPALRQAPAVTRTSGPTDPLVLPYETRDFSTLIWPATGSDLEMDVQISSNPGNTLQFRIGANGNLWCGQAAIGAAVDTVVTIASGSTALTVASPTTMASNDIKFRSDLRNIYCAAGPFISGMQDKFMIVQTGNLNGSTYQPQRHYVEAYMSATDLLMREAAFSGRTATVTHQPTWGGAHFMPTDGTAMTDVVIFYPDGTIWNTQVAYGGYTSATQVTLTSAAPQALSGTTVPVFLGRMGVKWFDTGIVASAVTTGDIVELNVNRFSATLLYKSATDGNSDVVPVFRRFIERFGGPFRPAFRPKALTNLVLSGIYVDDPNRTKIQPVAPPWELRGVSTPARNWPHGGTGGHAASDLRNYVSDLIYDVNDLCVS